MIPFLLFLAHHLHRSSLLAWWPEVAASGGSGTRWRRSHSFKPPASPSAPFRGQRVTNRAVTRYAGAERIRTVTGP